MNSDCHKKAFLMHAPPIFQRAESNSKLSSFLIFFPLGMAAEGHIQENPSTRPCSTSVSRLLIRYHAHCSCTHDLILFLPNLALSARRQPFTTYTMTPTPQIMTTCMCVYTCIQMCVSAHACTYALPGRSTCTLNNVILLHSHPHTLSHSHLFITHTRARAP
jgi:hypothetical protein